MSGAPPAAQPDEPLDIPDVERTLADLRKLITGAQIAPVQAALQAARQRAVPPEGLTASQWDQAASGVTRWGRTWKALKALGAAAVLVFAAGGTWALLANANATEPEVEAAILEHNGGADPADLSPKTGLPQGAHPELRKSIEDNTEAIKKNAKAVEQVTTDVGKLDQRSEYTFEFQRWQAKVATCRNNKNCTGRDLTPPRRLQRLESDLINGKKTVRP